MSTNNKTARIAGLFYLLYIVVHILADVIGRSRIIVYGDATITAKNIIASAWQFRIGFIGDILAAVLFLIAAWALYKLLKPVNKNLALLFLLLNLCGVAIRCTSDLFLPISQLLLSGNSFLNVFQVNQLHVFAMLSLYVYKYGFTIAEIFFSAWLLPLGYLVFKSSFLPKILGVVLMIHCATWLTTSIQFFFFPTFKIITYISYPLGFVAEFGLTLWLLIVGAREQK